MQETLLKATQENCELNREGVRKDEIIESSNKRLRLEDCLGGANSQLKHKNKERDELLDRAHQLRELWTESQVEGRKLKEDLEDAKQQLDSMANEYWKEHF